MKILIAEDNDRIREHLVMLLRNDFDIVDAVGDGVTLVAAAIELCPDVVVSDISMPRLSGPRAMAELKLQEYDIPFVFISADSPVFELKGAAFVKKSDVGRDIVPAVYKAFFGQT